MTKDTEAPAQRTPWDAIALATPFVLLGLLILIYLVSPTFYLRYVLNIVNREYQAVEILTFASLAVAVILLVWSTWQYWSRRHSIGWLSAALLAIVTLATITFAGEEISWGQTYFRWETPEDFGRINAETNLHNAKFEIAIPLFFRDEPLRIRPSMQAAGAIFIVTIFVALPLLWGTRHGEWIPPIGPAVAERPVVICMILAFIWKWVKSVYATVNPDHDDSRLYVEFLEQFNEHKEMLVAVGLLMYAIYRVRWIKRHPVHS